MQPEFRSRNLLNEPGATLSLRRQWVFASKAVALVGALG